MKHMIFLVTFVAALIARAGMIEDYEALKNMGRSLQDAGAICEEVSRLRFVENFPPPRYTVLVGVVYGANSDGVLGELDVVVFDNSTCSVPTVGEVKCWRNPADGLKKAQDQRTRFLTNIRSGRPLFFYLNSDRSMTFNKAQFQTVSQFVSVAQKGTRSVGYDIELPYSLNDLDDLRSRIMRCQNTGQCRRPTHQ